MKNKEILLNKINEKEREWRFQAILLQSKTSRSELEKRAKYQDCVNHLNNKLKRIEKQTQEIKNSSQRVWEAHGESIAKCWEELVHNVDYVIYNYKKIFEQ